MCDELFKMLKPALETLSIRFPFSLTLISLIEREFTLLSQREAYETLRYILTASGQLTEISDEIFSNNRWKLSDSEVKKKIEKCKNHIFDSIKNVVKENRSSVPTLKKSDLLLPYCPIFFSSCLTLASYALSYQLAKLDTYIWPRISPGDYESIRIFRSNLEVEEKNNFESQQKQLCTKLESLELAVSKIKEKKKEISFLLESEFDKCNYKNLMELSKRTEIISSWEHEIDDLHKKNLEKVKVIEDFNEQLRILSGFMVSKERSIISGKKLAKNIPFEVENFASKNGLSLCTDNHLNLPALFETTHMSIPKTIKGKEIIGELLTLRPPKINVKLEQKLEINKRKLEEKIENFHKYLGETIKAEPNCWLENFLSSVPGVKFTFLNLSTTRRDPVIDAEKLRRFYDFNGEISQLKTNNINSIAKKDKEILQNFMDMRLKNLKKQIEGNQRAIGRDSRKLRRLCNKRNSISLLDLTTLSGASFKSLNSEKVDSPSENELTSHKQCSTPKENYDRTFIYDRSISPISIHSAKDRSHRRKESCITNNSLNTENDIQVSYQDLYLSTDLDKSEKKQDTFEFTSSVQDISLDPTPSIDLSDMPSMSQREN